MVAWGMVVVWSKEAWQLDILVEGQTVLNLKLSTVKPVTQINRTHFKRKVSASNPWYNESIAPVFRRKSYYDIK